MQAGRFPVHLCSVSARDSGKPMVDAAFGEVIVTCEKLWWLIKEGERYLRPEARSAGYMVRALDLRAGMGWDAGRLGRWAAGTLGGWDAGRLGRWAAGTLAQL